MDTLSSDRPYAYFHASGMVKVDNRAGIVTKKSQQKAQRE